MAEVVTTPSLPAPTPSITSDTAQFWAATTTGQLLLRRCRACGEAIWYPRPICPFCHSDDTVWEQASGRGRIYSYTVIRRAGPPFAAATPYVLAYVELVEGPRMMTNIVDCDPEGLAVDQEVELVFHMTEGAAALPRFRPR
ncbi:MAG TPA: Zn-ribbon domain-containing OB-fold protein [Acidimicrobiales bacterium]|nr:Zn-ribbon domain-containing OB-fold protein [Acidimicrobiales bacterium]